MPRSPVAIVIAMRRELAPLLQGRRPERVAGVEVFQLESAVVAVSGIGSTPAHRAARVVVDWAQPELLISAGIAGAVSPRLKVGDVNWVREVVDAETGARYTSKSGEWVVASASGISSSEQKQELLRRYGADVVDMEAAALARFAQEQSLEFAAVKAVSDEADFVLPPLAKFVEEDGRFSTGRFLGYLAVRPALWPQVARLSRNSRVASVNLSSAVQHLIEGRSRTFRRQEVSLP